MKNPKTLTVNPVAASGEYLNQRLLDERLAVSCKEQGHLPGILGKILTCLPKK